MSILRIPVTSTRRNQTSWLTLAAAVTGMVLVSPAPSNGQLGGLSGGEKLIPGAYRQMTDDKGNEWSFQQNGVLGRTNNSLISGGMVLQINNNQFYNYQPFTTPDGLEYVLDNNQQNMGLMITRRIRLVKKDGWITRKRSDGTTEWTPPPQRPLIGGVNHYHRPRSLLKKLRQ